MKSVSELYDKVKQSNTCVIGVPEGGTRNIWEIMAENFLTLMKTMNPHVYEV